MAVCDGLNNNEKLLGLSWLPSETGSDAPAFIEHNNHVYYCVVDGNKNVRQLLDGSGAVAAEYDYDPFGRVVSATGPMADLNPIRFSGEYHDDETGLVYYNYRYYHPGLGKWLSRDPIEEEGGVNLYGMVGNDPVNYWDILGWGRFFVNAEAVDTSKGSAEAEAFADTNGFTVVYFPTKEDLEKCECGTIIISQAISSTGIPGKKSHIDTGDAEREANRKSGYKNPPPEAKPKYGTYGYFDSPTEEGIWTWRITAAAICVPTKNPENWFVIDTVYFTFDNEKRTIGIPEGANKYRNGFWSDGSPPTWHWKNAIEKWNKK